jgi:hypothetical protein
MRTVRANYCLRMTGKAVVPQFMRDPEIWRKTKEGASKAGGFTVSLLADLAKGLIRTQIEKHTGVKL